MTKLNSSKSVHQTTKLHTSLHEHSSTQYTKQTTIQDDLDHHHAFLHEPPLVELVLRGHSEVPEWLRSINTNVYRPGPN